MPNMSENATVALQGVDVEDVVLDVAANCSGVDMALEAAANGSDSGCFASGGDESAATDDGSFDLWFEFAVHGVLLFSVGSLGLLGNLFSVIILSRPQMKSSINTLLIGLVSCDSLLILTSICLFSFTNFR